MHRDVPARLILPHLSPVLRAKQWLHRTPKWIHVPDCDRPSSFQAIGRELLGARVGHAITFCVIVLQLGTCMVFLSYAADNVCAVERYYVSQRNTSCLIPDTDDYPFDPSPGDNLTTVMPPCTDDDVDGMVMVWGCGRGRIGG